MSTLRNAQNDVVKLIDVSGNTVVEYTYDTWGKKVTTTGTLAGTLGTLQPFRYRGYVYDWETGLYYLQSRYYDPEVGRFISSDVLLSTGQGVMGHNAYAYCLGNPVNMADESGKDGDEIDLIDDWYFRIDNDSSYNIHQKTKHIHIKNRRTGEEYNQDEDGKPHHPKKCKKGPLPRRLQKKLLEKSGWDYNGKRDIFLKQTMHIKLQYTRNVSIKKYTFGNITVFKNESNSMAQSVNTIVDACVEESFVTSQGTAYQNNIPMPILPMPVCPAVVPGFIPFQLPMLVPLL